MPCTPKARPVQPKVPPPWRMQPPVQAPVQEAPLTPKEEDFSDDYDHENLPSSMEGVAPAVRIPKEEAPLTPTEEPMIAEEEHSDEDELSMAVRKQAWVQFQTS